MKIGKNKKQINIQQNMLLRQTTILQEYISILESLDDCVIIIAVKDTLGLAITDEIDAQLRDLGLKCSLKDKHWRGYIAVIDSGVNIFEKLEEVDYEVTANLSIDSKIKLDLKSAPLHAGNKAEIKIGGMDYAQKKRGLNIVVLDKMRNYVVDSVCFDTHIKTLDCFRAEKNRAENKKPPLTGKDAKIKDLESVKSRLNLRSILPQKDIEKLRENMGEERSLSSKNEKEIYTHSRIEVRILYFGAAIIWNSLRTLALEFNNDPAYHLIVILEYREGSLFPGKEKIVRDDGLEYINIREYNVKDDTVDIFITNDHYVNSIYLACARFKVAVPFYLINGEISSLNNLGFILATQSKRFDCYFLERLLYKQVEEEKYFQNNIIEMGNPKFDCIYEKLHEEFELPNSWNKVEGKKVILWTTSHMWDTSSVAFDLYIKDVLAYFSKKDDMVLIIRPHYVYVRELIRAGVWTEDSYAMLKEYCNCSKNVIWDDTEDYSMSYSLADGVLTDTNCGIAVSAMVLDKPLGVMQRFDGNLCMPLYPELVKNLYQINSVEKCFEFFEMVNRGEDPLKAQRHEMFDQYISHFDGKNGKRIKEIIEQRYHETIKYEVVGEGRSQ